MTNRRTAGDAGGRARARRAVFSDLAAWLAVHDRLRSLDPAAPPAALTLPATAVVPSRLAVLAGSFNPLTLAHTELTEQALAESQVEAVAYALSVRIVNKERVTGASLEDRALALTLHTARQPGQLILLLNRGLYVDQATALRTSFPTLRELAFIVGYDKLVQIFDPRYYDRRDAALESLFALATLLVAPRDGRGLRAVQALLDQPENRRFAASVRWLPIADEYTSLSSTQVRQEVESGALREAVPPETRALLAATRVYASPRRLASGEEIDDYAVRLALLETIAAARPFPAGFTPDLPSLLRLARADNRAGRQLRAWLAAPPATPEQCRAGLVHFGQGSA